MDVGKLPQEQLQRLLERIAITDPRVMLGPGIGEDAAFIQTGNRVLVAATDPITLAEDRIGRYAVHINANDVAACGAKPQWFMATVLLPQSYTSEQVAELFQQLSDACAELEVSLVGGHTEVTQGLERPIVVGCMLGEVELGKEVRTGGARPGDVLLLTKGVAIEGTALLAREAPQRLEEAGVASQMVQQAQALLDDPGISVVKDALTAVKAEQAEIHAMHDPTEGGLAMALWELATAAGVGLRIDIRCIPVLEETAHVCQALKLDPLGLLASGSLLIALPAVGIPFVVQDLFQAGVSSAVIGNCLPASEGVKMVTPDSSVPLPRFERDELARFLEG